MHGQCECHRSLSPLPSTSELRHPTPSKPSPDPNPEEMVGSGLGKLSQLMKQNTLKTASCKDAVAEREGRKVVVAVEGLEWSSRGTTGEGGVSRYWSEAAQ